MINNEHWSTWEQDWSEDSPILWSFWSLFVARKWRLKFNIEYVFVTKIQLQIGIFEVWGWTSLSCLSNTFFGRALETRLCFLLEDICTGVIFLFNNYNIRTFLKLCFTMNRNAHSDELAMFTHWEDNNVTSSVVSYSVVKFCSAFAIASTGTNKCVWNGRFSGIDWFDRIPLDWKNSKLADGKVEGVPGIICCRSNIVPVNCEDDIGELVTIAVGFCDSFAGQLSVWPWFGFAQLQYSGLMVEGNRVVGEAIIAEICWSVL